MFKMVPEFGTCSSMFSQNFQDTSKLPAFREIFGWAALYIVILEPNKQLRIWPAKSAWV